MSRVLFLFALIWSLSPLSFGQANTFTYQGKLTDNGSPANGTYLMQFSLFDAASGGNQIGPTLTFEGGLGPPAVQVTNGVFTIQLDFGAPTPPFDNTPRFDGTPRWLQLSVRKIGELTYTPLTPRQPFTSSPYAIKSATTASADSLSTACVSCITNGHIQSLDGGKVTGAVQNANNATNALNVVGLVQIANGGTGSSTQNFVDLSTDQSVAGNKTFSGSVSVTGANGIFNGNGSGLTNLNASNISSGSLNIPFGQDATTVFSTSSITTGASFVQIPGLSQTVTVPANAVVLVLTDGGLVVSGTTSSTAFTLVDVRIFVDGTVVASDNARQVFATNSPVIGLPGTWSFVRTYLLSPGSHTVSVGINAPSPGSAAATTGSSTGNGLRDSLTVLVLKK